MSPDEVRKAKQFKAREVYKPFEVGRARCIREGTRSIQCQSLTLGRFWIPREALHPTSTVHSRGDDGMLVVRLQWARDQTWLET